MKLVPDWFVTTKIIKKPFSALFSDYNILCFNEDSGTAVFFWNEIGILNIDLNNIYLNNNLMKITLILLSLSDFWVGTLNLKNAKNVKNQK